MSNQKAFNKFQKSSTRNANQTTSRNVDSQQVMSPYESGDATQKLTKSNWYTWRNKIQTLMELKGLWHHVQYESFEEYILIEHCELTEQEVEFIKIPQRSDQKLNQTFLKTTIDSHSFLKEPKEEKEEEEQETLRPQPSTASLTRRMNTKNMLNEEIVKHITDNKFIEKQKFSWVKERPQAKAFLENSVIDKLIPIVHNSVTAYDAFRNLQRNCIGFKNAQILGLTKELNNLQQGDNESLVNFIDRVKKLNNKFKDLGEELNERQIVMNVLSHLTSKYEPFQMIFSTLPEEKYTLENLEDQALVQASFKYNSKKERKEDTGIDLYNMEHNQKCDLCGMNNHSSKTCRAPEWKKNKYKELKKNNTHKKSTNLTQCELCGYYNHTTDQCKSPEWKKSKYQYEKKSKNNDNNNNNNGKKKKDEEAQVVELSFNTTLNEALSIDTWYMDSGCTSHLTNNENNLKNVRQSKNQIHTALESQTQDCTVQGETIVNSINKNEPLFKLNNCIHVPKLRRNLISVGKICDSGHQVTFSKDNVKIINSNTGKIILNGKRDDTGLYAIGESNIINQESNNNENIISNNNIKSETHRRIFDLHRRLGHLSITGMKKLAETEKLEINLDELKNIKLKCEDCARGKMNRLNFRKHTKVYAKEIGDTIHSDLSGRITPQSIGRNSYFLTFTDEKSRYSKIYFIKYKSDAFKYYREYRNWMFTQFGVRIKKINTDPGGEYLDGEFKDYLKEDGTEIAKTPTNTPQRNGISERLNQTLKKNARTMMKAKKLPAYLWSEAVNTANYLKNISPTKVLNKLTPHEVLYNKLPNYNNLHIFGCKVMFKETRELKALEDRATEGIFVGYNPADLTYRIYHPRRRTIIHSKDVIFYEEEEGEGSGNVTEEFVDEEIMEEEDYFDEDNEELMEDEEVRIEYEKKEESDDEREDSEVTEESSNQPDEIEIREDPIVDNEEEDQPKDPPKSDLFIKIEPIIEREEKRYPVRSNKKTVDNYFKTQIIPEGYDESLLTSVDICNDIITPQTFNEATNLPEAEEWKKAVNTEIEMLKLMKTYKVVDSSEGKPIVKSKWVFKVKTKDGKLDKFKARLVAKGYSQTYGVDYFDTYSPVVKHESIRYLLAYALENNLKVESMDVVSAFLYADLEEDIYMQLPDGCGEDSKKIVKLNHALYGLKQASNKWGKKFKEFLLRKNFQQSRADPCVFFNTNYDNTLVILAFFVDDSLLIGEERLLNELKTELNTEFKMTEEGEVKNLLGIRINRSESTLSLDQEVYIDAVAERFDLNTCKTSQTPMEVNFKENEERVSDYLPDNVKYQQLIGCLLYINRCTRPDISFAVTYYSQKNKEPTQADWINAKRILRYLVGTKTLKLNYNKDNDNINNSKLVGYSDASYAEDKKNRKSITGYTFMKNGGAISWRSKKQSITTLSSTEAEYVALTMTAQECLWLIKLQNEIENTNEAVIIYEDNQSTIKLAENFVNSDRTKHIAVRMHFIRDQIENNLIKLKYIPTTDQIADVLTKPLGRIQHEKHTKSLGLG